MLKKLHFSFVLAKRLAVSRSRSAPGTKQYAAFHDCRSAQVVTRSTSFWKETALLKTGCRIMFSLTLQTRVSLEGLETYRWVGKARRCSSSKIGAGSPILAIQEARLHN